MICDRCNDPFHLRCTPLKALPPTYWYCGKCAAHHQSRGLQCPTEDLQLQSYLLSGSAPPDLLPHFQRAAKNLTFTDQLYAWREDRWLPFPPRGLQQLLLEEVHLTNSHIGGEKMFHLLRQRYFWPTMRHDCTSYVQHCFECQLSAGRTHGSW